MLHSFVDELQKIAKISDEHREMAEAHHRAEVKDWKRFDEDIKAIGFQKAIAKHPESDSKLKRYARNVGSYLNSQDVVGVAPSRTSPRRKYEIRQLPSGRWACGCGDWKYYHSVRSSDCDHVKALKAIYRAER